MDIIALLKAGEQNSGLVGWISGVVLAVFAWLGNRFYRAISHRITMAHESARAAAKLAAEGEDRRRDDVKEIYKSLNGHIERDIDMHDKVLGALGEQTSTLHGIHTSLLTEMSKRPTREEVDKRLQELQVGMKRR